MPLVSIIVPVYNVEKYLSACLDSLINQTLKGIEIICINDCATDNSNEVLDRYAKKDSRITIIQHTHNQGLGAARNTGVEHAKGTYIGFVDSDDVVSEDMYELLYNAIITSDTEMSMCGISGISQDDNILKEGEYLIERTMTIKQLLADTTLYQVGLSVCTKLFLKDTIEDIKQLPIISEDQPFLGELFAKIDKVAIVPKPCYYYRYRPQSLSKPKEHSIMIWNDLFKSHNLFFKFIEKKYSGEEFKVQSLNRASSILLWRIQHFDLLNYSNWNEHKKMILGALKYDIFRLKKNSTVIYYLLILIFKSPLNKSIKRSLVNKLIKIIRCCSSASNSNLKDCYFIFKIIAKTCKDFICGLIDIFEVTFIKLLSFFCRLFSKNKWLIGERIDTMQDNGYSFYNYIKTNHPKINAYYIFDKKNRRELTDDNRLLQYNSFLHKLYFLTANVYANSHHNSGYPTTRLLGKRYIKPSKQLNVFLQHGVIYSDLSPFYGKDSGIDLFVTSAEPEYDYVVKTIGLPANNIILTGLSRFDNLHNCNIKKQILFMPTWRRWLIDLNNETFIKSEYYQRINSLINSNELTTLLEATGFDFVFILHNAMNKYKSLFESNSKRIKVIEGGEEIPILIKDSSLLITDVSSVHFDFAYMKKPVIYYCWDRKNVFKYHFGKGYYTHEEMGFGPVVESEESLLKTLEHSIKLGLSMQLEYANRVDVFFPYIDENNSQRIYNEIIKKL